MRLKFVLGAVLVLVLHAVCSQGQFEPSNNNNLDVVANSVTNLAQKISRAIASSKSKTEIFSPVSIAGALSLLLLGSSGVTRDELTKLMGFDSQPINFAEIHKSFGKLFRELVSPEPSLNTPVSWRQNDKCNNYDYEDDEPSPPPKKQAGRSTRDTRTHQISVANGVFVDQNFQLGARYERLTKCLYQGSAQRLPFFVDPRQTAQRINGWAQQSTNGKIREIVTPDQVQRAPMVLASALYFKGKWETMFVEPDTRPRPFYVNGRNQTAVNVTSMATSGCFPYIDVKNWDAKIVGLPYQEGLSTMYLVVPNNSDRQKLQTFMNNVTIDQLNRTIDQMEVKTGAVVMPKMQLENNLELKQVLSTMGISTLFDPYKSNLSVIVNTVNDQDGDYGVCQQNNSPDESYRNKITTTTSNPNIVFRGNNVYTAGPYQPSLTTFRQPNSVIIPVVTKQDCQFIKNCIHDNNQCKCIIDSFDAEDPANCPMKPFYVSQSCTNILFSIEGWRVCKFSKFGLYKTNNKTVCTTYGCTFFNNQCYCCKNVRSKTTTSPPLQHHFSQSPTLKQQQQQNHQIASRIEIDDPVQSQRQPSSNAPNLNNNYYPSTETVGQQQGQAYAEHRQDSQYSQHNINQQAQLQTVQDPVNTNNYQTANPTRSQPKPTYIEQRQDSHNNQHNVQQQYTPKPHQVPVINSYNQNNPTAPVTCNYEPECDWPHPCRYVYRCHPIPYHEPRRYKRQANRSPLFVGDIVHKVSLDIDESGTEGGAVTAVVIDRISSSFTLRLNGPFLIYLRHDNTKLPLFYGPVYDPRD